MSPPAQLRFVVTAAVLLATAFAAEPPATHTPSYSEQRALALLKSKASDTELDASLLQTGIGPGKKHDEIVALVKSMRAVVDEGVVADSEAFWDLIAAAPGPKPSATAGQAGGQSGGAAAPDAATLQATAHDLWQRGAKALGALSVSQRERLLAFNHVADEITPEEEETRSANSIKRKAAGERSPYDVALQGGPPATFPKPADILNSKDNSVDKLGALLIRLGYNAKLDDAAKGSPAPAATETKAADTFGFNALITPPAFDADVKLRSAGLSFATGAGVIRHRSGTSGDASAGVVVARWNMLQRYATARWNQLIGDRNQDGYGLVSSYGRIEYREAGIRAPWADGYFFRDHYQPSRSDGHLLPSLTFFGPFLGSTIVGDKIREPGTTAADNKDERPYLIGWSLGWGFYDQAASLAYLDVGWTVSPHKGLDTSRNYIGLSFDAVVFGKLMSGIRSPAKGSN